MRSFELKFSRSQILDPRTALDSTQEEVHINGCLSCMSVTTQGLVWKEHSLRNR